MDFDKNVHLHLIQYNLNFIIPSYRSQSRTPYVKCQEQIIYQLAHIVQGTVLKNTRILNAYLLEAPRQVIWKSNMALRTRYQTKSPCEKEIQWSMKCRRSYLHWYLTEQVVDHQRIQYLLNALTKANHHNSYATISPTKLMVKIITTYNTKKHM